MHKPFTICIVVWGSWERATHTLPNSKHIQQPLSQIIRERSPCAVRRQQWSHHLDWRNQANTAFVLFSLCVEQGNLCMRQNEVVFILQAQQTHQALSTNFQWQWAQRRFKAKLGCVNNLQWNDPSMQQQPSPFWAIALSYPHQMSWALDRGAVAEECGFELNNAGSH